MSMIAIPFAVALEKVNGVFGSKDRNILDEIKTAGLYKHYSGNDVNAQYRYDLDQILEDIIFNYIAPKNRRKSNGFLGMFKSQQNSGLRQNMGHAYGYAIIVICDYLGTHLMPFSDGFYYGRDWEAACDILSKNGLTIDLGQIFETHNVFDIPPIKDFPAINCLGKQEIAHVYAICETIEIDEYPADDNNVDFDEVQFMLKSIRDCFKICFETQVELISFAH
jgi:hypothetical protein